MSIFHKKLKIPFKTPSQIDHKNLPLLCSNWWPVLSGSLNGPGRLFGPAILQEIPPKIRHLFGLTHCVKRVQIRSFFWSVFSCIRTEYGDLLRNQCEYRKMRIRENSVFGLFSRSGRLMETCVFNWSSMVVSLGGISFKSQSFVNTGVTADYFFLYS